jgi:hypothetical protein
MAQDTFGPRGDAVRIDAVVWQAPDEAIRWCAAAGLLGDSVIQIECTLRDAHGEVARNDLPVTVEVDGGVLLGIESGDLSDNTPYAVPERRSFDGRAIVFVRAGESTSLRLRAPGLPELRLHPLDAGLAGTPLPTR